MDRRAEIYRRIDETLGTFDGRIRAEQEAILSDRNGKGGENPGSGATAGDGKSATPAGTAGAKGDAAKGSKGQTGGKPGSGGAEGGAGSDDPGVMRSDRAGAARASVVGGGGAAPADVPDGRDDDIVARQIREAALKETDPELRDKLWDEYRKYKKGK